MEKAHSRIKWENYPSIATPLNETNLNKMDIALDEVDNRVLGLDTAKLDKAVANSMVKEITFDEATGIFTITSLDGTTKTVDTKLEKVATNFSYDYETQKLKLTLLDGTEQEIDMSSLISQYEFADTSTIGFTVGNEGKITAIVKDGSVTEDKLQPNFLADIKVEVAKGKSYSDSSYENATTSSNASKEAKQYRDEAKQYRDEVQAVVDVDVATTEKAGLVKPDGTTIRVDADGTIHADSGTVDYTDLNNKPSINGVELSGNLTDADLNIQGVTDYKELTNKPSINGTELNGDLTLDTGTDNYAELKNKPTINGVELNGDLTSADLKLETSVSVVDNLLSTSTTLPLSANQGRVLDEKISEVGNDLGLHLLTLTLPNATALEVAKYIRQNVSPKLIFEKGYRFNSLVNNKEFFSGYITNDYNATGGIYWGIIQKRTGETYNYTSVGGVDKITESLTPTSLNVEWNTNCTGTGMFAHRIGNLVRFNGYFTASQDIPAQTIIFNFTTVKNVYRADFLAYNGNPYNIFANLNLGVNSSDVINNGIIPKGAYFISGDFICADK